MIFATKICETTHKCNRRVVKLDLNTANLHNKIKQFITY